MKEHEKEEQQKISDPSGVYKEQTTLEAWQRGWEALKWEENFENIAWGFLIAFSLSLLVKEEIK